MPSLLTSRVKHLISAQRHSSVSNHQFWALRDVSFVLNQSESLALIGANGAGKTTILKLLANITKPTSGSININGQLSALIELGAGFHPDLTGRENIYLNGTILGLSHKQIASRFDEIVSFSEIERFIDTPVKRYSSGMVVRLGFAVASCIEPEILLVDEVLAVGDSAFQQKCLERIRSLLKNHTSIIFVSHNFYLIQAVCNHAIYLENGQVKYRGNTKEAIDLYEKDLHQRRKAKFSDFSQHTENTSDEIEITRVEVISSKIDEMVPNTEPVQIRIHYSAYQSLGQVHVSTFVKRADGLTCCMMRSKLDNCEIFVEKGQGIVNLYIEPLQLITGSYFVEAWFLNESDSMGIVSTPGRSDWFSVKGSALSYADDSGVFEPNTRWEHETQKFSAIK